MQKIKEVVGYVCARMLVGIYVRILNINTWRAKRKGHICTYCNSIIVYGHGIFVDGEMTAYCQECFKKRMKGG